LGIQQLQLMRVIGFELAYPEREELPFSVRLLALDNPFANLETRRHAEGSPETRFQQQVIMTDSRQQMPDRP
jgi:hypothetical protein